MSYLHRATDVGFEDGEMRNPLSGLFKGLRLKSINAVFEQLVLQHPNFELLIKKAIKKAKKVKNHPNMSECMKAAVVIYTMEDYPRENSPYFIMNKALRERNRGLVGPWRDYIWLLLHALREIPPGDTTFVVRGCQKLASELGEQCAQGGSFIWSSFSSTATTVDVMKTFLGTEGPRTLFQLTLFPGIARSIQDFSLFPNENEVLLPINVEFDVTSICDMGHELTLVQCTQIESDEPILNIQVDPASLAPAPAAPPPAPAPVPAPAPAVFAPAPAPTPSSSSPAAVDINGLVVELQDMGFGAEVILKGLQQGKTGKQQLVDFCLASSSSSGSGGGGSGGSSGGGSSSEDKKGTSAGNSCS
jgi:hypothetical protein